jgi:hypothetical protein
MKPEEEPLQRDSLPTVLTPGFARRVINQARAQRRRRQLRRRLAMVSVICCALGFGISTLIRSHFAKPNAAPALSKLGTSTEGLANRPVKLADEAEHSGLENPLLHRRLEGDYVSDKILRAAGPHTVDAHDSVAAKSSQTLVIKVPARVEEAQTSVPAVAIPEDSHDASVQAPLAEQPGAGGIKQPSIQLP